MFIPQTTYLDLAIDTLRNLPNLTTLLNFSVVDLRWNECDQAKINARLEFFSDRIPQVEFVEHWDYEHDDMIRLLRSGERRELGYYLGWREVKRSVVEQGHEPDEEWYKEYGVHYTSS